MKRFTKSVLSIFLIFSFLMLDFSVRTANAKMVDTETMMRATQQKDGRDRIIAFLERKEVQQAMAQHNVSIDEAKKRVAALTDAEVMQINQTMDRLPAGGDGVGVVVGAAVFIFVVLLITDLLGLTHVFSFVNRR
jgi:hypothetical protein